MLTDTGHRGKEVESVGDLLRRGMAGGKRGDGQEENLSSEADSMEAPGDPFELPVI